MSDTSTILEIERRCDAATSHEVPSAPLGLLRLKLAVQPGNGRIALARLLSHEPIARRAVAHHLATALRVSVDGRSLAEALLVEREP